jgi:hypothetical protein
MTYSILIIPTSRLFLFIQASHSEPYLSTSPKMASASNHAPTVQSDPALVLELVRLGHLPITAWHQVLPSDRLPNSPINPAGNYLSAFVLVPPQ